MLRLVNISKIYKVNNTDFYAIKNVSISFEKKGFISILGPSGCGKTTLLNIIGGLDHASFGELFIDSVSTSNFNSRDFDDYRNKKIGFVFQTYNLISHLKIIDNVSLSLNLSGVSKKEQKEKSIEALKLVGLEKEIYKKPNQLSGGQQQRVAIARAIVNDPEIILADEPTGALDSQSSLQVMEILKKISQNRLVILVTHNRELALNYSSRIVELKDGKIINDSNPLVESNKEENNSKISSLKLINKEKKSNKETANSLKKERKSYMNFFSSIKLSFLNLITKKGRTIITSIAGSFGIIGVALVLALSNGFTNYVNRIQSETASMLPIQLPSYSVTYESQETDLIPPQYTDEEEIYPVITGGTTASYTYNNFTNRYLNYLDYLKEDLNLMNDYIINYSSSYSYNLMTDYVNSDGESDLKIVRNINSNNLTSLVNSVTGSPNTMFHVLYGEEEYVTQNYDLISGKYPSNANELVLVVDRYNRLDPDVLIELGFYNEDTTDEEMFNNPVSFDDLYNKKFKVFSADDFYSRNQNIVSTEDYLGENKSIYVYDTNNYEDIFNDNEKGITLQIVGILRPSETSTYSLMTSGLCYTKELQEILADQNNNSEITNNFLENAVFNQINSKTNEYYRPIDLFNALRTYIEENLNESGGFTYSTTEINNIINEYMNFYSYTSGSSVSLSTYLTLAKNLGIDLLTEELKGHPNGRELIEIATDIYTQFISLNSHDSEEYKNCIKNLIAIFAYLNSYSSIQSIVIFPKDLTSKETLITYLESWNQIADDEYHAHNSNEIINYTDIVGDLTAMVGQMINIISIVLIIFASISLIVSCVMTGIITYVSVIERTKEIGILRSLGARKLDVGRLFVTESSFIGLLAGVIGAIVTYIICLPLNTILNSIFSTYNLGSIASLNPLHALLLIAISIALTFISGLFPSIMASKKDPVTSLRTE